MSTRRRLMMQSGEPIPTEYIQDGLVFWLDGIDKGATDGSWVDLINGVIFANRGAIVHEKSFETLGNNKSFLECIGNMVLIPYNIGTIEIGYNTNSSAAQVIFGVPPTGRVSNLAFRIGGAYSSILFGNDSNISLTDRCYDNQNCVGTHIFSVCYEHGLTDLRNNIYPVNEVRGSSAQEPTIIGGRSWFGQKPYTTQQFIGNVFFIRIYNRYLSNDEMKHNQQIDNIRFNLGL